jgi:hypothetical protein
MTMKAIYAAMLGLSGSLLLAGCGGGGGASGKSADWAVDACKSFPKEAAAKASGVTVAKSEVSGTGSDQTALSNCVYSSADGKDNFGVMLRQDKTGEVKLDEQVKGLTAQQDVTGPMEEVPMPKGKAFWAPKLNTLSWVPDDTRMIVVTPPGAIVFGQAPTPAAELKAKAIAIATAVEG